MTQEKLLKKIRKNYGNENNLKNLLRQYTYEGYDLKALFSDYNSETIAKLLIDDFAAVDNLTGRPKEDFDVLNTPGESAKYEFLRSIIQNQHYGSKLVNWIEYFDYKKDVVTNQIDDRLDYLIRVYNVNKDKLILNLINEKSEKGSFNTDEVYSIYADKKYPLSDDKIKEAVLNYMYKNLGDVTLLTNEDYRLFVNRAIKEQNIDYLYQFLKSGRTDNRAYMMWAICQLDDGTYACKITDEYDNGKIELSNQELNDLKNVVMNSSKNGMKFAMVYKNNRKVVLDNFDNSYSKIYAYYSMLSEEDKKDVPKAYVDEILTLAKQEINTESALEEKEEVKEEPKDTLLNRLNNLAKNINENGPAYIDGAKEKGKELSKKVGEKGKEFSAVASSKLKETKESVIKSATIAKGAYDTAKKTHDLSNTLKSKFDALTTEDTSEVSEVIEEKADEKEAKNEAYEKEAEEFVNAVKEEAKSLANDVKSYVDEAKEKAPAYVRTFIRMFKGEDK